MDEKGCHYCNRNAEGRKVEGNDVCQACYRLWKRHGKIERIGPKPALSNEVIDGLTQRDVFECLLWKGDVDRDGYPRYYDGEKHAAGIPSLVYVRRWVLEQKIGRELVKGEITEDICDERLCVSEDHLALATIGTGRNTPSGINSRKTHCENGHEYAVVGVYLAEGNRRQCMQCRWESHMRHIGKNPAEHVRGIHNGDKTHCPWGHAYDEKNTGYNPDGSRYCRICSNDNMRRYLYGITPDEYIAMREAQDNRCLFCKKEFFHNGIRTSANVDHCHECTEVRGILCENCNRALGLMYENVDALQAAIDYVKAHRDKSTSH
ncbi:endonuclease VII domain-containing protein [Streptosporangium subroseum]|uniref:endonuclease VII domain-containing protein n=1 Tax=Streptosporangium subroseum TaxID=106412 RepID=UPI00342B50FE